MHWSEYEPPEITGLFDIECNECLSVSSVPFTGNVWRDGSIYGSWDCPECYEGNYTEDVGNVADFVDHDAREGK
jgi:hypothetical protein